MLVGFVAVVGVVAVVLASVSITRTLQNEFVFLPCKIIKIKS